eukprot:g459.t1
MRSFPLQFNRLSYQSPRPGRNSHRFRNCLKVRSHFGGGSFGGGGSDKFNFSNNDGGGHWNQPNRSSFFAFLSEDTKPLKSKAPEEKTILLTLCSFAVTRAAFSRITKNFKKFYKEQTGKDVRFRLSYGGSGVQARAVIDGLPADIVALALPLDVIKIQQAGLIDSDWQSRTENNGIFAESVVSIVVRKENPLGIKDWPDLTREDVEVITANPKTAGVARWNFLALWGHKMSQGEKTAIDYVTKVFDRVPVQPRDAREASDVFYNQEFGDALLTYENEVYMTNKMVGEKNALPYVVPNNNIRVEAPVALVDKNLSSRSEATREAAKAFVDYLFLPEAQREFVACGFRPVNKSVQTEVKSTAIFPPVQSLWTVDKKLGGWLKAQEKFFDANAILDEIQTDVAQRRIQTSRQRSR